MIKLNHLDGEPFLLNAELIRFVEARPDTFITLTCGERIVVQQSMDEVLQRAIEYQQTKFLMPSPSGARSANSMGNSVATVTRETAARTL